MKTGLDGKKVLVTGSTLGLGRGIAEMFAEEGAHVIVNGRNEATVNEVCDQIAAKYPHAVISGIAADVSTPEGIQSLYEKSSKGGPIDILINNTGIYFVKKFAEVTDDEWFNIFNVNIMSVVRLCRLVLPEMLARNSGKIINIASEAGLRPNADMIHYSATKSCMIGLSRGLAELTKGSKVTVNSVLPVATWTEGVADYIKTIAQRDGCTVEEAMKNYYTTGQDRDSLIQRFLTVDEVSKTVLFAAINDGVNGNAILIDGGTIKHI